MAVTRPRPLPGAVHGDQPPATGCPPGESTLGEAALPIDDVDELMVSCPARCGRRLRLINGCMPAHHAPFEDHGPHPVCRGSGKKPLEA